MPDTLNSKRSILGQNLYKAAEEYLIAFSNFYPSIQSWFKNRVVPETSSGRRIIILLLQKNNVVGIAIAKKGKSTKLCSMHINDSLRNLGVGSYLLKNILDFAHHNNSKGIHFTMNEEINIGLESYFLKRNFRQVGWLSNKYIRGMDEFVWNGKLNHIKRDAITIVPGITTVSMIGQNIKYQVQEREKKFDGPCKYRIENQINIINKAKMVRIDPEWAEEIRIQKCFYEETNPAILHNNIRQQSNSGNSITSGNFRGYSWRGGFTNFSGKGRGIPSGD